MTNEIPLSQGKFAIVDDDDYEWLSKYNYYYVSDTGYARRSIGYSKEYMHRDITACPPDMQVDHVNGNRLDNRRSNLRVVTRSQNHMNRVQLTPEKTSEYRGVSWHQGCGRWQVQICKKRKHFNLGLFKGRAEAAFAYDTACLMLFGEHGRPNFTNNEYRRLKAIYPETLVRVETHNFRGLTLVPQKSCRQTVKASPYRGVYRLKGTSRWCARIVLDGKQMHLGRFDTEEQAARAYDEAVIDCRGYEAKTNFPISDYA